jgi:hypothetical protein
VAGHERQVTLLRERDELLHLLASHRGRLLDEHVLAREQRVLREGVVRRDRRRDHDRVDLRILDELAEVGVHARVRIAASKRLAMLGRVIAQCDEVGDVGEVTDEVLAPVAEPGHRDPRSHSFQTFSDARPVVPVALRRSTISSDRSTRSS